MSSGKIVGDSEQYQLECTIAKGAFSTVYRCVELTTNKAYAIKVVPKDVVHRYCMTDALIREMNAMEVVGRTSYVVGLVDKLVSRHNYYLIMDLAEGGTLLDLLGEWRHKPYHEWVPRYFRQLLLGLQTLHVANVVHRDIKPENLLLNKERTRLMISDFGFACYAPRGRPLHRACGTLKFCAPELLTESPSYDGRKVDVWAAGVTLYLMMFKVHPFQANSGDTNMLLESIAEGTYIIPPHTPHAVRHLLSVMLHVDPSNRWSVNRLLKHPWLAGPAVPRLAALEGSLLEHRETGVDRDSTVGDSALKGFGVDNPRPSENLILPRRSRSCPVVWRSTQRRDVDDGFYHYRQCGTVDGLPSCEEGLFQEEDFAGMADGDFISMHSTGGDPNTPSLHCRTKWGQASRGSEGSRVFTPTTTYRSEREHSSSGLSISSMDSVSLLGANGSSSRRNGGLPMHHRRGFILTIKVVFNFCFFCTALIVVGTLRVLFGVDFRDLPIPQKFLDLVEYLLIPPHERAERRRAAQQRDRESVIGGVSESTSFLPRRFSGEGLRHLVRKVEKLIQSSQLRRRIFPMRHRGGEDGTANCLPLDKRNLPPATSASLSRQERQRTV